ncbi:MAG: methylenetetrahydrofolate reductase [NAD(P)H] [Chloroflexi bacterium]|nr:methylenetetrahydrofolate reductase [NAD(P)H] [Chloroflexota bacterium]
MKIGEITARKGSSLSFEFFPSKTPEDEDRLLETVRRLEIFAPTFVSVTYGAGGGTKLSTRQAVKRIKEETSLTVMPHLTSIGQSRDELEAILLDYRDMGIENILALRGDPPKETAERLAKNGLAYARDLVELAASFGAFSIGVAVYPEGHCEAPSLELDMAYTKAKIDAGADFAITQMFFDNDYFYRFMERAELAGISIPIIPGIMPVIDIQKIRRFSELCGATLPGALIERMTQAASPEEAKKIGIDFAIEQCEDLQRHGVRFFHFYTLNKADVVTEILHSLNLARLPS